MPRLVADALIRAALLAQRLHGAMPSTSAVRWLSGRLAHWRRVSGPADEVRDAWTEPLIAGHRVGQRAVPGAPPSAGAVPSVPINLDPPPLQAVKLVEPSTLRCLIATDALYFGGTEEVIALLARNLPRHGVATTVLYTSEHIAGGPAGEGLADRLRADGVGVVRACLEDGPDVIARVAPDVVSAHMAAPWVFKAAAEHGVPVVETVHMPALGPEEVPEQRSEALLRSRIAGVVAVSSFVRQQYLAYHPGLAPERVITIPNGVDARRFGSVHREQARAALGLGEEFLFVCLARQALQKNLYGLVTAFATVADACPDAHLLIAGAVSDPLYHLQIRRLRDRMRCAGRVHLRGYCAQPAVLLEAADAFVLNSFYEGWPLAPMEALCAGLPVVMSEVGGARELAGANGARGCVVPNPIGDPLHVNDASMRAARYARQVNHEPLVSAMIGVVRDRGRWAGVRERLRAEAATEFDADICLRRHAAALKRVAHGAPIQLAASREA